MHAFDCHCWGLHNNYTHPSPTHHYTAFVRGEDEKLTVPDEANWLVNYYIRFRDSNALDLTDAVLDALNKV